MRLGIYSYYNKLIKAFDTKMQFDDHNDDKVVFNVSRGLNARLTLGTYQDLKYLQFYRLGYFDDETGAFEADKEMLLDFDVIISKYESKLDGGLQDVGSSKN